jgi:putative phosphoesterase
MMKKIMVISDTHEDMATIRMVVAYLKDARVDMVIHLGDYYNDTGLLENEGHQLIKVPGTWDPHYYDPNVPNRRFIEVAGWKIFLTHTPESHYNDLADDLKPEKIMHNGQTDLFLYGHTHRAEIKQRKGVILINPGHMSCDEHRGCPLTFALLEINEKNISASLWQLFNDEPFLTRTYEKPFLRQDERLSRTKNRASFS